MVTSLVCAHTLVAPNASSSPNATNDEILIAPSPPTRAATQDPCELPYGPQSCSFAWREDSSQGSPRCQRWGVGHCLQLKLALLDSASRRPLRRRASFPCLKIGPAKFAGRSSDRTRPILASRRPREGYADENEHRRSVREGPANAWH